MRAVKLIETRSWPAPKGLVGSTVIIHAAKRKPTDAATQDVGDWQVNPNGAGRFSMRHKPTSSQYGHGVNLLSTLYPAEIGKDYGYHLLPLGAVVGSVRLAGCYPMMDAVPRGDDGPDGPLLLVNGLSGHLWLYDESPWDVEDQRPYGDFTPGRWAWLLTDAAPITERCPACEGTGYCRTVHPKEHHPMGLSCFCDECEGEGRCDPIPARGGQRIWKWNGLPALTLYQPWASLCVTESPA